MARRKNGAGRRASALQRAVQPDRALHAKGPGTAGHGARIAAIDSLRGFAIVAMIAYHFAYDLRLFGLTQSDFENDPWWIAARTLIVGTFLVVAGISLVLADRAGVTAARFARRVGEIAACALVVSIVSYVAFPRTFIYFGILHAIALSLALGRPLVRRPRTALVLGLAIVAAGSAFAHPLFDARGLSWIGFTTVKPPTQDFVPLFPWLGVLLVGIALGHALASRGFAALGALRRAPRLVQLAGQHSLPIYMLHQPLLIGALWLVLELVRAR
jgi:uncharacterized membrane protein